MTHLMLPEIPSLLPPNADKYQRYRLGRYERWLRQTGRSLLTPDLAAYRDALLAEGYAPATVAGHLSSVRAAYQPLLRDRDYFYRHTPANLPPADRKAMVDEIITRLKDALEPAAAPVRVTVKQDRADAEQLRLTTGQADALMERPGLDTIRGLRDTALIALMLCTGIREAELCGLDVADLRARLGGELALHVRRGKGRKERLVPYGALSWVLLLVDRWRAGAEIDSGPVFRGFYKGNQRLRPGRLSVRAVQYILADYPLVIDGQLRQVRPHDLRRTYARRLYEAGVDLVALQQNLGHASQQTTLGYIGTLDADRRRPPRIYRFADKVAR